MFDKVTRPRRWTKRTLLAATIGVAAAVFWPSPKSPIAVVRANQGDAATTAPAVAETSAAKPDAKLTDTKSTETKATPANPAEPKKPYVKPSPAELQEKLTPIQFKVTQNESTEPPFKNEYWDNKATGQYRCVVCELPLFESRTKYKSGTGWPSFYAPISTAAVGTREDWRLFYSRTECHCSRCGAHLGHVFDDGPEPTGKRYCMNSAAMNFVGE